MSAEPLWYKDAIIYEVHVKCFFDSNGDGIGDFKGLTEKLDYLHDLGITAIWLLPFYPSPLKDDGYDISDYTSIHPSYGTLSDFKRFLREANRRGLKVITELVINHTSDEHPWFERARNAKIKTKARNFYVWNKTPDKYQEARIIFQDFESSNWAWDKVAESYYWHRFYAHQPDLNFDSPQVRAEIKRIMSFWFKLGVAGVRLDAVPYLYEREGTSCENLPETHVFLKELRSFVDAHFPNRMFLAEANQWPEDAAKYFGEGDECHMAFHFPIMPRLFMAIHLEDSLPIIEIHGQTPHIPDNCQWALFLRNHDELTLEMVTDIERDYMFRVYAHDPQARVNLGIRRRLAPLLKNDRRKIELMNSLLFSLIGTPVLYYGDEIGMGDNIYLGDRDGVRTPMQWSNDRNAGFSRTNPQRLYLPPIIDPEYHYETVNVEAHQNNTNSLLWWTKQLIALRKRFKAFGHGSTQFLLPENRKVLVFIREFEEERIFIIANLSRYAQYVELDLSKYQGFHLIELFSGETFPKIGELPYFLTLGPYGYYWFLMEKHVEESLTLALKKRVIPTKIPLVNVRKEEERIFNVRLRKLLENHLEIYLLKRGWLEEEKEKAYPLRIIDHFVISKSSKNPYHLVLIQIITPKGLILKIPLVLSIVHKEEAARLLKKNSFRIVSRFKVAGRKEESILLDRTEEGGMAKLFGDMIRMKKRLKGEKGELVGVGVRKLREKNPFLNLGKEGGGIRCEVNKVVFPHERGVFNLFIHIEEGVDLDVEMRRTLYEKTRFRHFIPLLGYLEYRDPLGKKVVMADEVASYPEEYNALKLAHEDAERFLLRMEAEGKAIPGEAIDPNVTLVEMAFGKLDKQMHQALEGYLEVARLLGECTADFHRAVGNLIHEPDFAPTPFTLFYQRSLYQTIRRKIIQGFNYLKTLTGRVSDRLKKNIYTVLDYEEDLLKRLHRLTFVKISGACIRHHGNYVLENLLYTGKEFLIASFSPKKGVSSAELKLKRSALRDLVSLLYSFAEAGFSAINRVQSRGHLKEHEIETLQKWGRTWYFWMSSSVLRSYFRVNHAEHFLPQNHEEIDFLLSLFLIEQCMEHIIEIVESKRVTVDLPVSVLNHWLPIYS